MISSLNEPEYELRNLYIVTSIFNPAGFQKRYDLYYKFEAHLKKFGVNLVTIECVYNCFPNAEFSVTTSGNPFHIQIKTDHPLWHKENLINIAIQRLPQDWKYVLWLDADIEFIETDWPERILQAFSKYDIIQVFKYCHFLGPEDDILETHFSFNYSIVQGIPIDKRYYHMFYPHPGYGWGITRHAYEELNGLIDYGILGSSDAHMAFALINKVNLSLSFPEQSFHPNYLILLEKWMEKAHLFTINGRVGYAECSIKHYFHGYREDRKYVQRMTILIDGNFDPINDIFYDQNGLLQIKDHKSELRERIFSYFQIRNEDESGKDRHLKMSMTIPKRSLEELLANAEKVKKLVETEQLRNAMRNIHPNKVHSEKRSASVNERRSRRRGRRSSNHRPKKIEIVYELRHENSLSNSTISDSDSQTSQVHSFSVSSNNPSLSPNRSVNQNLKSEDLMYQCGACCSKKKDKEYPSNANYNSSNNYNANKPQQSYQNSANQNTKKETGAHNQANYNAKGNNNQNIQNPYPNLNKQQQGAYDSKQHKDKKKKKKNDGSFDADDNLNIIYQDNNNQGVDYGTGQNIGGDYNYNAGGFDTGHHDTGHHGGGHHHDAGGHDNGHHHDAGGHDYGHHDAGGYDYGNQNAGGYDYGNQNAGGYDNGNQDAGGYYSNNYY